MKKFYTIFLITFFSIIILATTPNSYSQVELENIILACDDNKFGRISFQITNGSVTDFNADQSHRISGVIQSEKEGSIIIEFDRSILDAKKGWYDDDFFVLINGAEIPLNQVNDLTESIHSKSRILEIPFEKGRSDLEIFSSGVREEMYSRQCEFAQHNIEEEFFAEECKEGTSVWLNHQIINGSVTRICAMNNVWVELSIDATNDGSIDVDLPRNLINSIIHGCMESDWEVFLNGGDIRFERESYQETKTEKFRNLSLNFTSQINEILILSQDGIVPEGVLYHQDCDHLFNLSQKINIPPVKQTKFGISPNEILCNESFVLIFKASDNSPICVKPATVVKLFARGWVTR